MSLLLMKAVRDWIEYDLTQFEVLRLCNFSTCGEMGDCFATEANTMIDIVCEVDLN